jgi:hypothetical protein
MSVFLWCLGSEIFGVGASRAEAEKDALDRIFDQTIGPLEKAAKSITAGLESLVPSLESFRLRGLVVEYGFVGSMSIEMGSIDFDALIIKQLRGEVERGVAVIQNAPPSMQPVAQPLRPNGAPQRPAAAQPVTAPTAAPTAPATAAAVSVANGAGDTAPERGV